MKGKKILIVDDMEFDREILKRTLAKILKCEFIEASGGEEALQVLGNQKVDIVLLDIEMPGISGDELVSSIRKSSNLAELPIVMVSGNSQDAVVVKCMKAGANDYITKPINFEVAITRITNLLKLSEAIKALGALQQMAALNAMVATYNHEINNPLAIALGSLHKMKKTFKEDPSIDKMESALIRISDIVKKITEVTQQNEVPYEDYTSTSKMVKVK